MQRKASLSKCGLYRYTLSRRWQEDGEFLVWVMLNPSTADAEQDDPTIRRVIGFSKREGFGGLHVVNIWALRATSPKDLHARREAYEPENLCIVRAFVEDADVVVAWGGSLSQCPALTRVKMILRTAHRVRCLGVTKSGQPRHPLYLRADTLLVPWPTRLEAGDPAISIPVYDEDDLAGMNSPFPPMEGGEDE